VNSGLTKEQRGLKCAIRKLFPDAKVITVKWNKKVHKDVAKFLRELKKFERDSKKVNIKNVSGPFAGVCTV